MEKRLLLAIVLSFAVLFGYQLLFQKKAADVPAAGPAMTETTAPAPVTAAPAPAPEKTAPGQTSSAAIPAPKAAGASGEIKTKIDTSLYQAVWSNKGGVLVSWKLKKHLDEARQPLELVPKTAEALGVFPFALLEDVSSAPPMLDFAALQADPLNAALYETSGRDAVLKDGDTAEIRFRFSDGKELEVEKIYTFTGGRYDFQTSVRVLRAGKPVETRVLWGPGIGNPTAEEMKKSFGAGGGMTAFAATRIYRVDEAKYKPEQSLINFTTWSAYDDNYFCALFLPAGEAGSAVLLRKDVEIRPALLSGRESSRPGLHRAQGLRRPDRLRPRRQEARPLRDVRHLRRGPLRRHQGHPQGRPQLGLVHHHPDPDHQDHLLPPDLQPAPSPWPRWPSCSRKIKSLRSKYKNAKTGHRPAAADERRDDEALQGARRQPRRRLPADAHPDPLLLRHLQHAAGGHRVPAEPLDAAGSRTFRSRIPTTSRPSSWASPSSSARR